MFRLATEPGSEVTPAGHQGVALRGSGVQKSARIFPLSFRNFHRLGSCIVGVIYSDKFLWDKSHSLIFCESMLVRDNCHTIMQTYFSVIWNWGFFKPFMTDMADNFQGFCLFVFSSCFPLFTPAHDCSDLYKHHITRCICFPEVLRRLWICARVSIQVKPCQEFQSLQSYNFNFNQSVQTRILIGIWFMLLSQPASFCADLVSGLWDKGKSMYFLVIFFWGSPQKGVP